MLIEEIEANSCKWCGQWLSKNCTCSETMKTWKEPFNKEFWIDFLEYEETFYPYIPYGYRFNRLVYGSYIRNEFSWYDHDQSTINLTFEIVEQILKNRKMQT